LGGGQKISILIRGGNVSTVSALKLCKPTCPLSDEIGLHH
jgi:hypothetical protein